MSRTVKVALVMGDGAAPEMMEQAIKCIEKAAQLDDIIFDWLGTPVGWDAYKKLGDTLPTQSLKDIVETGLVFFGGVGDFKMDKTIGKKYPKMMPESRALLKLRKEMGLLLNFRPAIYRPKLQHLSRVDPRVIPDKLVEQRFVRFLQQDSYFGNTDLGERFPELMKELGVKDKSEITGEEEYVVDTAYYTKEVLEAYFRHVFAYAQSLNLPLISIDKANVMSRYVFWRKIAERISKEYPDVPFRSQYVDSANMQLFDPAKLHGVIACGNEHGDILSDGGLAAVGGLGMMHSSAINPSNNHAMFESGAGTACDIAGQDKANPVGRILTGGMLLRHINAQKSATALENAVWDTIDDGWRTGDIAEPGCDRILGCSAMGDEILSRI